MASSSVPGAFAPYKIYGQYFIDGAVADPLPVRVAQLLGAKYVVAVDISELLLNAHLVMQWVF